LSVWETELALEVILRHREGKSQRQIASALDISRKKVRTIIKKHKADCEQGMDALEDAASQKRTSLLDDWMPRFSYFLEKYPDITGVRLHEELRDEGYEGGISILRERLRLVRPTPVIEPVIRFETSPGIQGQMDWSPYTINFTRTGRQEVLCFSYILGYSRRQYIDFTLRRDFYTLIRRHVDAYQYFGGVPKHCLYDNEKTVSLRWEGGHPVYNPAFLRFLIHYGTRPIACRPRRPQTKGKIEEPFDYLVKNLFNGRTFRDMEDLRAMARWWLANRSDLHRHRTTGHPPIELFERDEKAALLDLPAHPYDTDQVLYRVGNPDGTVAHDTNKYSIPFVYAGMILPLKISENEVRIFTPDIKPLATHERQLRGAGRTMELEAHRLSQKDRYGLEPCRETFLALGEHAAAFLEGLTKVSPRRVGLQVRLILAFKELYHSSDINLALQRACRYHAYEVKAVGHVLKARAKPRHLESSGRSRDRIAEDRQLPSISQRDLVHYAHLDKGDDHDR